MDKLTIKQAAEILKCSHQTIRRKIAKGDIPATKEQTEFGEAWYIPGEFVGKSLDVIPSPMNDKAMAYAIGQAVEVAFKKVVTEHTDVLRDEIHQLRSELDSHYRRIDERIRIAANPVKPKGFFNRLFG